MGHLNADNDEEAKQFFRFRFFDYENVDGHVWKSHLHTFDIDL
jgi:hypothetical protein